VRHTIDQEDEWPVRLDPKALSLNTWVGSHHVRLSQELLDQVGNKGVIAGDERFIIGENDSGDLVILGFDILPSIWDRYRTH
jgi:hypothetical protein